MASLSRKIKRTQLRKNRKERGTLSLDRNLERLQNLGIGMGSALVLLSLPATGIAGTGFTVAVDGKTTTYNQTAPKVFNRVDQYNIAVDELHRYNQPSSSAIFVQRVIGRDFLEHPGPVDRQRPRLGPEPQRRPHREPRHDQHGGLPRHLPGHGRG